MTIPIRNRLGPVAWCLICVPLLFGQPNAKGNGFLDVQVLSAPVVARISGQQHLVYELHITNFTPVTVTITEIDVLHETALLHSYAGTELANSLARVGAPRAADRLRIEGGCRAIFYVWLPLLNDEVPSEVRHRISFRTEEGSERSVDATPVRIAQKSPAVLGPPPRGGPWVAVYDPGLQNGHRRVVVPTENSVSSSDACSLSGIRKQWKVKRGKSRLTGPLFLPAEDAVSTTNFCPTGF